ncbi:MAG: DUF1572 family protein [Planctomycetes bacterium]|nr:DUF1572 family protein [Planctomycetota bacterium]
MPMETNPPVLLPPGADTNALFLAEARATLAGSRTKVVHCLQQLSEPDCTWRPAESQNSIQNIILHLCGNLTQWILHGIGGAPDHRDRPAEFADRRPRSSTELATQLTDVVLQCDQVLAALPGSRLRERTCIQGFEVTLLGAIFEAVSHFVGHQHQIVYITRWRLGDRYQFEWSPETPAQGAPTA